MSKQNRTQHRERRAAELRAEQARQRRSRRLRFLCVLVAVLVVAVGAQVLLTRHRSDTSLQPLPRDLVASKGDDSLVVGNDPQAKVRITVYEDFLCPFCREFESSTRELLHRSAEQGKVLVEYRPFRLLDDDYSKRALNAWSSVLERGTPRQALRFHDLLYADQPYENSAHKPSVQDLEKLAKKAGVTDRAVLDGFETENTTFYDAVQKRAEDAGVRGTPTVLVDGKQVAGTTNDEIVAAVKKAIAGS